jgi:hypothetical protein
VLHDSEHEPAVVVSLVIAKWAAHAPLALVDASIGNLKKIKAIAIDAGDMDEPIATTVRTMRGMFESYGLAHRFAIHEGNHVNRISERRASHVLPFFAANLTFPEQSSSAR